MALTRISIATPDIIRFFDSLHQRIFTGKEINQILSEKRADWRLTQSFRSAEFLEFLLDKGKLTKHVFEFPNNIETRFTWGQEISNFQLGLSLRAGSHLSHFTALYLHGLTDQVPKVIYVNKEQAPPRHRATRIDQSDLDRAFKRPARTANRIAELEDTRYCLLESMGIDREGIVTLKGPFEEGLDVTGVERTLIDCTVRPMYSGGVFEVLEAFKRANKQLSISRLLTLLKKLQYVYPYHQSIGFYLEKSRAYGQEKIDRFKKLERQNDFYLDYNMKKTSYSHDWRLHYPDGM